MRRSSISAETFETPSGICRWEHSKQLDRFLGYKIARIEQKLSKKYRAFNKSTDATNSKKHYAGSEVWVGLNTQALQTPYVDILCVLKALKPFNPKSVIDLGAGYGRVGIVYCSVFLEGKFTGIEILPERYLEAVRVHNLHDLQNCKMVQQDLVAGTYAIPKGDVYFIYDFSHIEDIDYVLRRILQDNLSFFIVAVGERVNRLLRRKNLKVIFQKSTDIVVFKT